MEQTDEAAARRIFCLQVHVGLIGIEKGLQREGSSVCKCMLDLSESKKVFNEKDLLFASACWTYRNRKRSSTRRIFCLQVHVGLIGIEKGLQREGSSVCKCMLDLSESKKVFNEKDLLFASACWTYRNRKKRNQVWSRKPSQWFSPGQLSTGLVQSQSSRTSNNWIDDQKKSMQATRPPSIGTVHEMVKYITSHSSRLVRASWQGIASSHLEELKTRCASYAERKTQSSIFWGSASLWCYQDGTLLAQTTLSATAYRPKPRRYSTF